MRSCGVLECQYALSAASAASKEESTENSSLSTLKVSIARIVFIHPLSIGWLRVHQAKFQTSPAVG